MENTKKPFRYIGFGIYFILLSVVFAKLFFEAPFDRALARIDFWKKPPIESIAIGLAEPMVSLNPLANDTGSRARLLHIYEPLIRLTKDLQIEPSLALSYGALDNLTWEFRLRPDVKLHNGAPLTLDDVMHSIEEGKNNPSSGVRDAASSIKEVKKIDEERIHIITNSPDPLLLPKLSQILIFPKNLGPTEINGTGPYALQSSEAGALTLKYFENYWGDAPTIKNVSLRAITKKEEKIASLRNSEIDILANLPADIATTFDYPGYQLRTIPSLEINFLMFNIERVFQSKALRQAVLVSLKLDLLMRLAQGFAVPATQFVGNGIFGFDPTIQLPKFNPNLGRSLVQSELANLQTQKIPVTLDLPKGLEPFGKHVKSQLDSVGFDITLSFLNPEELGTKIMKRESDFFFFGWKNDLGDSLDFLTAAIHSPIENYGQFNGASYRNPAVDQLIEESRSSFDQKERLKKLRAVMRTITVDDVLGVPLFSPEVLYGVSKSLPWTPRVDGYVLAQDVKL